MSFEIGDRVQLIRGWDSLKEYYWAGKTGVVCEDPRGKAEEENSFWVKWDDGISHCRGETAGYCTFRQYQGDERLKNLGPSWQSYLEYVDV